MRRPVLLVLVAAPAAVAALATGRATSSPTAAVAASCGVERWPVKTLTDSRARLANLRPRPTTVRSLRRLRPPASVSNAPRLHGVEMTTYRVRAALVGTKHEDDEDFHLVVADPRNLEETMIVEFPNATCTSGSSRTARLKMQRARSALIRACGGPSDTFTPVTGRATIDGVGFFDVLHGQTGVALNGIELHPVLAFTKGRCRPR